MTPNALADSIIWRMKFWLTITNLYHFAAWFIGWESFANITQPLRDSWF